MNGNVLMAKDRPVKKNPKSHRHQKRQAILDTWRKNKERFETMYKAVPTKVLKLNATELLFRGIRELDIKIMKIANEEGAEIKGGNKEINEILTPLQEAARIAAYKIRDQEGRDNSKYLKRALEVVDFLIKNGADLNSVESRAGTALDILMREVNSRHLLEPIKNKLVEAGAICEYINR